MINCQVFRPEQARGEDQVSTNFWGNKPAVPPLTTESVVSVVYLVEDEPVDPGGRDSLKLN